LAFLKIPEVIDSLMNRKYSGYPSEPYFLSKQKISKINETFLGVCGNVVLANPAVLAWGLILHTIAELANADKEHREQQQFNTAIDSFQSNTQHAGSSQGLEYSLWEDLLDCARTPIHTAEESISSLTSDPIKESVFDTITILSSKIGSMSAVDDGLTARWIRLCLIDSIRLAVLYLEYTDVVESVLAILDDDGSAFSRDLDSLGPTSDPKCVFAKDSFLMDNIFNVARSRFPYETSPFLRLCRVLVSGHNLNEDGLPDILDELEDMQSFTQIMEPNFQGYATIREDEDANFVALLQPLPMFEVASHHQPPETASCNALVVSGSSQLPTQTIGQVISDSKPAVIKWVHQYSCLSFLGSWLEEWSENGGQSPGWTDDTGADIIALLTELIANSKTSSTEAASGKRILEMASDGLSKQGDIISVVFDIFERNLQNTGTRGDANKSSTTAMACLGFIKALIKVLPSRVWPFLGRSSFIGTDGKGGMMSAIISAMEVPSGEYPFLVSCVGLVEAVIDDAASRAVLRRSPSSVSSKSTIASDWSAGIPSHVMRNILLNLTRVMVEIFNSSGSWRFNLPEQRFKVNSMLAASFERVLYYAYGINDGPKLDTKITGVFSTSAAYILDTLRPQSTTDLTFNPILRLITEGLQAPPTLHLRYLNLVETQVNSTLRLCIKLVQAAQLAEKPTSLLEEQLFKASPVLVKLYALHDPFKLPVVSMLEVLISSAASIPDNEPPSLVGHLGAESSCLFLDVLSQLDKPLGDTSLQLAIWQLLSTFVSKRQQWLAVFILTGASPRQTLKKGVSSDGLRMRSAPFLQMALEKLSHIDQLEPQVALALLEFVSRAQENWPWATPHIGKHHQFFTSIINHVSKMKINKLSVMDQIYSTRIAAVVADLCAVYMHSAKEVNDRSFIKTMIPLVSWFSDGAVEVSAYNASLHANLKKNFENRYSGCKIIDFKRTPLEARTPGQDYYYDLSMAEKLLSYDFAWAGSRNRGFADEFQRANINLSLVEAQVVSFYSYPSPALSYLTQYRIFSTAGSSSPLSIAQTSCPITKFESQWRLLRRTASLPILKAVLPRPSLKESSKRALTSLKLSSSGSLRWVLEVPRSSSSLKSPGRHCEPDTRHMKML
jgi:nuclear pore complex protein Nup188